jgi:hypothetical protein
LPKKTRFTASDICPSVLPTAPGSGIGVFGRHRRCRARACSAPAGGVFAEADAGQQILLACPGRSRARRGRSPPLELAERELVLARLAFQQLAADLNGALALVLVEPVLDLVARARALGKAQPVAAGRVAGLRDDLDDVAVAQLVRSGTMRPFTLAPTVVLPTSV